MTRSNKKHRRASHHKETQFFRWKPKWEETTKSSSAQFLILLHEFVGPKLRQSITPKICNIPLAVGYNLIEASTSKMQETTHSRLQTD